MNMFGKKSTNKEEIDKFSHLAHTWWDENGPFRPLHLLNPTRISYILQQIKNISQNTENNNTDILKNYHILDIGSGGGILSEPLACLGANVLGIDASEKCVQAARWHAHNLNSNSKKEYSINYQVGTPETLAQNVSLHRTFDVILAMEVLEHNDKPFSFFTSCKNLLKENGIFVLSTINKTAKAFLFAIVGAEYIMRWLPRGTHDFRKFIKPSDLVRLGSRIGFIHKNTTGFSYAICDKEWHLSQSFSVNYAMTFQKKNGQ